MKKPRVGRAVMRRLLAAPRAALLAVIACVLAGAPALAQQAAAPDSERVQLQIVGGLAVVTQYTKFEKPCWESDITARSGGRITAAIRPRDGGGLREGEMLQLMRLGVVPFGTASSSLVAGDEPELNIFDLPILNPDMETLRRTVTLLRGHLSELLRTRYDIELLGVYVYPAQVIYCAKPFSGLGDLAGRTVRTSSVGQSELMKALGAVPVPTPFSEIVASLRNGVVECAITGTLSGFEIGIPGVASHVHTMAISWGVSFFGANLTAWNALPPDLREIIRTGVADLEQRIWQQAEADTARGLACNTGAERCGNAPPGTMTLVPSSTSDEERRQKLLAEVVLPRWIERCGTPCANVWNTYLAPAYGFRAKTE